MKADVVAGGDDPGRNNFDVAYVARLARIELTAEETALFQTQLAQVLKHAARLQEVNVDGIEPAAHASPQFDVLRADETRPGLTQEEALRNAPRAANGLFLVPKVIE
ncbi:Asp-tRNA(Asn)/Glu-tRNA(Gln) amidotransferase subunit GatC [soil metagenome]|nr:Asp-tRNA(Asn)/Glu-tRNA(Gln) amidotransferase subunit GatC [Chthoniobacterales bacterium]